MISYSIITKNAEDVIWAMCNLCMEIDRLGFPIDSTLFTCYATGTVTGIGAEWNK